MKNKSLIKILETILPHACIILSAMILVFYFIDKVNPAMAFINNNITKALIAIWAVCSILSSLFLIRRQRRRKK